MRPLIGIFVGGESRRMGTPKGLIEDARGVPLLVRAIAAATPVGDVVIVGNATAYASIAPECPRIVDAAVGIGPLGGLVALLRHARSGMAIAIGCDMPYVEADDLRALAAHPSTASVLAARRAPSSPFEPLFARYDAARVLPIAERRMASTSHGLQALLRDASAEAFEARPGATLDWDEPGDVSRGRGRIPG